MAHKEQNETEIKAAALKALQTLQVENLDFYNQYFSLMVSPDTPDSKSMEDIAGQLAGLAVRSFDNYNTAGKKDKYRDFPRFLDKCFSDEQLKKRFGAEQFNKNFGKEHSSTDSDNSLENYLTYLVSPQIYVAGTINASVGTQGVLARFLDPYRHGYLQIYDSPFTKKNEKRIIELKPDGQTVEKKGQKIYAQAVVAPGFVTMALDIAGTRLINTGHYDMNNYRPWDNDCITLMEHTQQSMNLLLPKLLQQELLIHYRFSPDITRDALTDFKEKHGTMPTVVVGPSGPDYILQQRLEPVDRLEQAPLKNKPRVEGDHYTREQLEPPLVVSPEPETEQSKLRYSDINMNQLSLKRNFRNRASSLLSAKTLGGVSKYPITAIFTLFKEDIKDRGKKDREEHYGLAQLAPLAGEIKPREVIFDELDLSADNRFQGEDKGKREEEETPSDEKKSRGKKGI